MTRRRDGSRGLTGLIHTDAGSARYTSIAFTERLAAPGSAARWKPSGTPMTTRWPVRDLAVQDRADQAVRPLAHSRASRARHPEYVDWFNHRKIYETCGDIPPAELEAAYYRHNTGLAEAG